MRSCLEIFIYISCIYLGYEGVETFQMALAVIPENVGIFALAFSTLVVIGSIGIPVLVYSHHRRLTRLKEASVGFARHLRFRPKKSRGTLVSARR